jgi:hypothetical protein
VQLLGHQCTWHKPDRLNDVVDVAEAKWRVVVMVGVEVVVVVVVGVEVVVVNVIVNLRVVVRSREC